jgi:redox-sensitive bicupin YhaK (pirin superfamily)
MFQIRKANRRGHADHGWLNTYHTFSFADYHDPAHMGFRVLRVINEDRVQPGEGFGTHGHRDMEIVTYVLEGALEHKDSMGHGAVLKPGEFQRITAGKGILHSEFNPSPSEPVHFYQIWLLPRASGLTPGYEQRSFEAAKNPDALRLVASPDGRADSLRIEQDAEIYLASLTPNKQLVHPLQSGRYAWLQVLRGAVAVDGHRLETSDGVAIGEQESLAISADAPAEVMLFDLP